MFGRVHDEEPVGKSLMASSSAPIRSQNSVNGNLVTIMVERRGSSHYFGDAIIRDLKHRLQDYVHLATPRKNVTVGGTLLDGTVEGVLQGLATDDYGNQIFVRTDIMVVPGVGRNLFSVTTATK